MAWVAEEDFNSYDNGDLNGKNGGSGWASAWSGSTAYDVQSTTRFEGAKAVINTTNSSTNISRALTTATSSGVVYFTMRFASGGYMETQFKNSVNGTRFYVVYNNYTGNIALIGSSSVTLVSSASVDTWYSVEVTYNTGTNSVTAKTKPVGGAWSSASSDAGMTSTGSVDNITLAHENAEDTFWDSFSASEPTYHDPIVISTITDGIKLGDVVSAGKLFLLTLTDGLKLGDAFSSLKTSVITILDGLKLGDVFSSVLDGIARWTNRTKPSTTFTNRTKPSTSFTDRTKPTTTWTKVDRG